MLLGVDKFFFVCSSASSKLNAVFPSEVRVPVSCDFCELSVSKGEEGMLLEPSWSPGLSSLQVAQKFSGHTEFNMLLSLLLPLVIRWLNAFTFRSDNNVVGLC